MKKIISLLLSFVILVTGSTVTIISASAAPKISGIANSEITLKNSYTSSSKSAKTGRVSAPTVSIKNSIGGKTVSLRCKTNNSAIYYKTSKKYQQEQHTQ